jgi:hypothetical protein
MIGGGWRERAGVSRVLMGKFQGKRLLEDPGVDGMSIFESILQ